MDKRKKFPGGEIEITNDEINLMPESNQEGLFAVNKGIGNGANMIISGVGAVIDPGNDVTVLDGFVFLNGEMLKVDAQVVPKTVGADLYQFEKVVVNNLPEWDRNYRDATTHNIYEKNRAVPVNVLAITTISVVGDTMLDVMKGLIQVQSDFDQADNTKPDYIKNQPNVISLLLQGKFDIGQVGFAPVSTLYPVQGGITSAQKTIDGVGQEVISVSFPSLGTANYHVLVTAQSAGVNPLDDNDVSFVVYNKQTTSFQFSISGQGANEFVDIVISIIPLDLS
jgi:hypothetical protein